MLRKILLIAKRDFLAVVLTKGFLFGMLSPLFFGALTFAVVRMMQGDAVKRVAIVDQTGAHVAADMIQMVKMMDAARNANSGGARKDSTFQFEIAGADARDLVKKGELYSLLEIQSLDKVLMYTSTGNGGITFEELEGLVNNGLRRARLARAGIDPVRFGQVLIPVPVEVRSLSSATTGSAKDDRKRDIVRSVFIPAGLMVMMMILILTGSVGMLVGVAEDKKERVFEMLLASATPFEIIAGKIMGAVGGSLTYTAVWMTGALAALYYKGLLQLAPMELLPWFLVYLLCNLTMLGAMGAALGAASATPRDAQQLNGFLVLPVMLPSMMLVGLMDQPNGTMATAMSFFPPFTPMVMLLRQAMPGGAPAWQPWVALLGVLVWSLAATWAASRVFRVGLLMQGKQPSVATLLRWAFRG